jgi:hypothetical protein
MDVDLEGDPFEAVARFANRHYALLVMSLAGLGSRTRKAIPVMGRISAGLRVLLLVPEGRRGAAVKFLVAGGDSLLPSPWPI